MKEEDKFLFSFFKKLHTKNNNNKCCNVTYYKLCIIFHFRTGFRVFKINAITTDIIQYMLFKHHTYIVNWQKLVNVNIIKIVIDFCIGFYNLYKAIPKFRFHFKLQKIWQAELLNFTFTNEKTTTINYIFWYPAAQIVTMCIIFLTYIKVLYTYILALVLRGRGTREYCVHWPTCN